MSNCLLVGLFTDHVEGRFCGNKPRARVETVAVFRLLEWIELDRFGKVLVIDLMYEGEKESKMTLDS